MTPTRTREVTETTITPSGRLNKSPTPGVFTDTLSVDPTASDPRKAPPGTPIAFPDPDEDYPTEGEPYPPPTPEA